MRKKRSREKEKLVFQSDRRERRGTNSRSKAVQKKEERKARRGRTGAETKGQRDRQRQVEKIAET